MVYNHLFLNKSLCHLCARLSNRFICLLNRIAFICFVISRHEQGTIDNRFDQIRKLRRQSKLTVP